MSSAAFSPLDSSQTFAATSQPFASAESLFGSTNHEGSAAAKLDVAKVRSYEAMVRFGQQADVEAQLNLVFGQGYDGAIASQYFDALAAPDTHLLPNIELVEDSLLKGENGVYATAQDKIYISRQFAEAASIDALTGVLIEELGHGLDARINQADASGDEGDLFARLVLGKAITEAELALLKAEDDSQTIVIDGQQLDVEMNTVFNNRLYQVMRGDDNGVYTRSSADGENWTEWTTSGDSTKTLDTPSMTTFQGKLYQTIRGVDNGIYTRFSSDGVNWGSWRSDVGGTLDAPSIQVFNNRLFQTVRGGDNGIYTRSSANGIDWEGWRNDGGGTLDAPSISAFGNRLFQSVRGGDNGIYTRFSYNGYNWTGWTNFGGGTFNTPEIAAFKGKLYQTVRGGDNAVYVRTSTDGAQWTGWQRTGGSVGSKVGMVEFGGKLRQVAIGLDQKVYFRSSSDGQSWGGFRTVGNLKARDSNYVVPKPPAKAIKLTSLNGGEQLTPGQSTSITWTDNFSENVRIDLYKGSSYQQTISTSTTSDGQFSWTVPTNLAAGSDYKLKVSSVAGGAVDYNDSTFTIESRQTQESNYAPNQLLVKAPSDFSTESINYFSSISGLNSSDKLISNTTNSELDNWRILNFKNEEELKLAKDKLKAQGYEITRNYSFELNNTPNDSQFNELWGLNNIGQTLQDGLGTKGNYDVDIDAPEAWEINKGSQSIKVAILDTGIDHTHPDLAANMWRNPGEIRNGIDDDGNGIIDDIYGAQFSSADTDGDRIPDFVIKNGDTRDAGSHGTHVAGTIGAVGNNYLGIVGVSHNVSLMAIKIYGPKDADGKNRTYMSDVAQAISYAIDNGADIINYSSGGYHTEESPLVKDAIERANDAGILFVASAGNDNIDNDNINNGTQVHGPSGYNVNNIVSVAATNSKDQLAYFGQENGKDKASNYGLKSVDLGAPGKAILSTISGGGYGYGQGTSMAAPHVSGAAALLLAENPNLTVAELKNALLSTVDPVPALQGKTVTGGRLNVYKALKSIELPEPKPDLIISSASAPTSVTTGQTLSISALTKNVGNGKADTSTLRYWLSNDTSFSSDDIEIGRDGVGGLNAGQSERDSHTFTYSQEWGIGRKYILFEADGFKIVSESNEDNNVTARVINVQPKPYITVTSPNGGNNITPGDTLPISWKDNISGTVNIDLYKGNQLDRNIASSTESDGSYDWDVPVNITGGSDYEIRISSTSDASIYDESDSFFSLSPQVYSGDFKMHMSASAKRVDTDGGSQVRLSQPPKF